MPATPRTNYSRIPEIIAKIPDEVALAVSVGAELVADGARARVPFVTGRLHDAIHTEPDPEGLGVEVLAGDREVFYGRFVEHGTVNGNPPHPFLLPALEANRETIVMNIRRALQVAAR